ncbi:hypothetical protein CW304_08065 [Bacillus sp. UFRGS-B20]|nr:hypothetical protein CW304_08065 [Bacillus sp. UFRGS-B20]
MLLSYTELSNHDRSNGQLILNLFSTLSGIVFFEMLPIAANVKSLFSSGFRVMFLLPVRLLL